VSLLADSTFIGRKRGIVVINRHKQQKASAGKSWENRRNPQYPESLNPKASCAVHDIRRVVLLTKGDELVQIFTVDVRDGSLIECEIVIDWGVRSRAALLQSQLAKSIRGGLDGLEPE